MARIDHGPQGVGLSAVSRHAHGRTLSVLALENIPDVAALPVDSGNLARVLRLAKEAQLDT
jgi:hypothetical protein